MINRIELHRVLRKHGAAFRAVVAAIALIASTEWGAAQVPPSTVVTTTADSGVGSLRQAIINANNRRGTNTVSFNIPGAGPHRITLLDDLPNVTNSMVIDGFTQPGARANSLPDGNNSVVQIEIFGDRNNVLVGLNIFAGNCVVRGVAINNCFFDAIFLGFNARNTRIEGCFIGVRPDGRTAAGSHRDGIFVDSDSNVIGGTSPAARNLISGNDVAGVRVFNAAFNQIQGNWFGTDISGTSRLGIQAIGVRISGGVSNLIGGTVAGARNIIAGNVIGVSLDDGSERSALANRVEGNYIGLGANGVQRVGNLTDGVLIDNAGRNVIGGLAIGAGNIITASASNGVSLPFGFATTNNSILGNAIYANGRLGIDLGAEGVTANDTRDPDAGPNGLQNYPVLTSVGFPPSPRLVGTFNSVANRTYRLEFFANAARDASNFGEGERRILSTTVVTDGAGNVSFDLTPTGTAAAGDWITATATDPAGSTSEFSRAVQVSAGQAPNITQEPRDADIEQGLNASFAVTATGSAPLAYQWFFKALNGAISEVSGGTSATLFLAEVQTNQMGCYYVRVTNSFGAVTSLIARLTVRAPNELVPAGAVWRYRDDGSDQGTNWISLNFNDSAWASGPAELGYGEGDEATIVSFGADPMRKFITTYFRHRFVVSNPASFPNLQLRLLRDDGVVVYLNGREVVRDNMPEGVISNLTESARVVMEPEEFTYFDFFLSGSLLRTGTNVLAVEIHQTDPTSSDISFNLQLRRADPARPVIVTQPAGGTFEVGDPVTLTVGATGPAPLSYQWFLNGSPVAGAMAATLSFPSIQLNQAGGYVVVVSNPFGSATSTVAQVTVVQTGGLLVATGTVWKYLDDGSNQGSAWTALNFNDAAWREGPAQLGYGDGDEATVVGFGPDSVNKYITTYFRRRFVVTNPSRYTNLILRVLRDDGVIVHLNGREVFRDNLTNGPVLHNTTALVALEADAFLTASISPTGLQAGTNVLAVEIHQASPTSSDISFDLELLGEIGVATPPVFTAHPQNQAACAGQTVTFSATVTGTAPIQYQWQFNGAPIAGATNAQLTLNNISLAQVGNYQVVAQNAAGSAMSAAATLTVSLPPTITRQPANVTVPFGAPVSFSIDLTGTPPVTYQWFFNNAPIAGATGRVLEFEVPTPERNGAYRVVAANACGSVSSASATLTVESQVAPPVITRQPVSLTVTQGTARVAFSIAATGPELLVYQWLRNGAPMAGETAPTFAIQNVQLGHAANYAVRVRNNFGEVVSAPAALTVFAAPTITRQPVSLVVTQGNTAVFSVGAEGNPAPSYQWQRDGTDLAGANGATLAIANAQPSAAGRYAVRVNNGIGSVLSAGAILTVRVPPQITRAPVSQVATQGGVARFTVEASGSGPLSFQWRRDGLSIPGATDATLTLSPVQSSDAADYSVRVSNAAGAAISPPARLTVLVPPTITQAQGGLTVREGDPATLTVVAQGTAPLNYEWQFNGRVVQSGPSASFTRASATTNDTGDYRVIVSNAAGQVVSAIARLTVRAAPRITNQPSFIQEGGIVRFSVGAVGATRFQWRLNGANIVGATNATYETADFLWTNSGSYTVVVENDGGAVSGDPTQFTVQLQEVDGNDNFAQRAALSPFGARSGTVRGDNRAATSESNRGEPQHAGKPGGRSVWFSWRAPGNGVVALDTIGSTFDTLLAVYTGSILDALRPEASDDDAGPGFTSALRFLAREGETYQIAVDGYFGDTGTLYLNWLFEETSAPVILRQPASQSVLAGTPRVTFTVEATNGAPLRYQWFFRDQPLPGATSASLVIDDAQVEDVGPYAVSVTNRFGFGVMSLPGLLELTTQPGVLSQDKLNDLQLTNRLGLRAAATPTPSFELNPGQNLRQDLFNRATHDKRETNHCGVIGGSSRWLSFNLPGPGTLRCDTIGSDIDTVLAVYRQGVDVIFVHCDNDSGPNGTSILVTNLTDLSLRYLIAVDGVNGAKGHIQLNVSLAAEPQFTNTFFHASVPLNGSTTLRAGVRNVAAAAASYRWLLDGNRFVSAPSTNTILPLTNFSPDQAGTYSVVASNLAGLFTNRVAALSVQYAATWQLDAIEDLPSDMTLGASWARRPDDAYALAQRTDGGDEALLLSWNGRAWQPVPTVFAGCRALAVVGTGESNLFVAANRIITGVTGSVTNGCVFFSPDSGATWTSNVFAGRAVSLLHGVGDTVQVVVGGTSFFRFRNGTWTADTTGNPPAPIDAVFFVDSDEGYCFTRAGHGTWNGNRWIFCNNAPQRYDVRALWGIRVGNQLTLYAAGPTNGWRWRLNTMPNCLPIAAANLELFPNLAGSIALWGAGPNEVYAVGPSTTAALSAAATSAAMGQLQFFNGTTWSRVGDLGELGAPSSLTGGGPDNLFLSLLGNLQGRRQTVAPASPPRLLFTPRAEDFAVGDPLELSVTPLGTMPQRWQWYRESQPLAGETRRTLIVPRLAPGDSGRYRLEAVNSAGTTIETVATVNVLGAPAIVQQPADLFVRQGERAAFQVAASGGTSDSPLLFQWFFNGRFHSDGSEPRLALPPAQSADRGDYFVIVTNRFGATTSRVAHLEIDVPARMFVERPSGPLRAAAGPASSPIISAEANLGQTLRVLASTNLVDWTPLRTPFLNFGANNRVFFSDPDAATLPKRFYKMVPTNVPLSFAQGRAGFARDAASEQRFFRLLIRGELGDRWILQATTNLTDWTPLLTHTMNDVQYVFTDFDSPRFPNRLYRLVSPNPPLRLDPSVQATPGQPLSIAVSGNVGDTVVVESSLDLRQWSPVSTNTLTEARWIFRDTAATRPARLFFRARRL